MKGSSLGFLLLVIVLCVLLSSCNATKPLVSQQTLSDEISFEEKMELYGGRKVRVDRPQMFCSGEQWLDELTDLVRNAEDYIFISTYLGSSCDELEDFYELLCTKAERGVRVYFYIDASSFLELTESKDFLYIPYFLRDRGVNLIVYNPFTGTHAIRPEIMFFRDHRKIVVVDGKYTAIGGMNTNYISIGAGELNQRDSMFLFESPSLISALVEEFVYAWNRSSIEKISIEAFNVCQPQKQLDYVDGWLFSSNVLKKSGTFAGMYGSLINNARSEVDVFTIIPLMNDDMIESLNRAYTKGVEINIYCNIFDEARLESTKAVSYQAYDLIDAGINLFEISKDESGDSLPLFHLKLMAVDNRYLVIGSPNFNFRSMALSDEICLVIDSPEICSEFVEKAKLLTVNPTELSEEEALSLRDSYGSRLSWVFSFIGG